MKIAAMILGAAALLAVAPAAFAQAIEAKNLASGKAKIDPDKGYVFLRGELRQNALFLRLPDDAARAQYAENWAKALEKAQAKYAKALKRYESDRAIAVQTKQKLPEAPVEPTPENFSIDAIELMDPVAVGPQYIFAKAEAPAREYSYLHGMKPGRYVYYGPVSLLATGVGTCYCMGSVSFEVKAGAITDLGDFLGVAPGLDPAFPPRPEKMRAADYQLYRPAIMGSGVATFGLPSALAAYPATPPDFRAHGKLGNFYGITVSRMPPIAGVLAYDRDRVIDVVAEQQAAAEAERLAAAAKAAAAAAAATDAAAAPPPAAPAAR